VFVSTGNRIFRYELENPVAVKTENPLAKATEKKKKSTKL
jgi:hypothetical protein